MAVGRNDPCPCGSGKRYKQCHGGIAAAAAAPAALAADPANFDALHMQGVVAYQRREYHRAEALIRRAIAIRPQVETAHHNLTLVLQAHALEAELCRAMLPALAAWCEPAAPAGAGPAQVITFEAAEDDALRRYRIAIEQALAARAGTRFWRQRKDGSLPAADARGTQAPPRTGTFVFVGTRAAPGPWYRDATPGAAVLVCHEAAACEVYDQIRAVTHELAHRVHLWFAGDAVAREAGLPGGCGDAAALSAWLDAHRAGPA